MKARNAAAQGLLAALGLVAAYVTWQRPPQSSANESTVVVDATKQSLQRVRFEDGTRFLELERTTDGEPATWVTQGFLPGQAAQWDAGTALVTLDGGAADGGAALLVSVKPPEPTPTRQVKGNERADTTWARFAPFEATRSLGVQPNDTLRELGLDDERRRLEVTVAGTTKHFLVSKPQAGVFGTYLRETTSGQVYLLSGTTFSELDPAAQVLVDRRLHTWRVGEADRFTVTADGQTAEFVVTGADVPQTMKVARAAKPDAPEELVKNWYDKVWNRLVVTDVLGKGETPKAGAPKVSVRLDLQARGKAKGWLELGVDAGGFFWARSENTAGWVAVHQNAGDLMAEATKLVVTGKAP